MALMAAKVINLSTDTDQSSACKVFLKLRITNSKIGIMTRKLRITIRVALLPALEAIPETMLAGKPRTFNR